MNRFVLCTALCVVDVRRGFLASPDIVVPGIVSYNMSRPNSGLVRHPLSAPLTSPAGIYRRRLAENGSPTPLPPCPAVVRRPESCSRHRRLSPKSASRDEIVLGQPTPPSALPPRPRRHPPLRCLSRVPGSVAGPYAARRTTSPRRCCRSSDTATRQTPGPWAASCESGLGLTVTRLMTGVICG